MDVLFYVFYLLVAWLVYRNRTWFNYHLKFFLLYLYISTIAIVALLLACTRPFDPTVFNTVCRTMPLTNFLFGFDLDLRGVENLYPDRGGFVVVNHQTMVDVVALFNIWPMVNRMTVVAKKTLLFFFPLGPSAWLMGSTFIDRDDRTKSHEAMQQLSKTTKGEKPTKVLVFVEGTRNKDSFTTKKLLPFKKGAFKMAVGCQVPITPIVIGPYHFLDSKNHIFGTGTILMKILPPIETVGMTDDDVNGLKERVQKMMQDAFDEFYEELANKLPSTHPLLAK